MAANELCLNSDKTKLIVFGNKTMASEREKVSFQAGAHIISPSPTHTLLGAVISQDLMLKEHILSHEN